MVPFRDLGAFLRLLWEEWKLSMTGGAFAVATFFLGVFGYALPAWLAGVASIALLFFAGFNVWRREKNSQVADPLDPARLEDARRSLAALSHAERDAVRQIAFKGGLTPTEVQDYLTLMNLPPVDLPVVARKTGLLEWNFHGSFIVRPAYSRVIGRALELAEPAPST